MDIAKIDIVDPDFEGNYWLANVDIGARFNIRSDSHKAIPYLQGAVSGRAAQTTVDGTDIMIAGRALSVGAGLNYYFQPKVAFEAGLTYSFGTFDRTYIDGDEYPTDGFDASGARLQLGLTWFPFASDKRARH
jgi:hypothetical protein